MKRLLFPLALVWGSGLWAQTPTPAQGRDYLTPLYRVISVDTQGRIIISPTGIVAPCPGTVANPCIVAGPDAAGAAPTKSPVLAAGQDGAPGLVRVIKTDALGQLIPSNASSADADGVSNTEATPTGAAGGVLYPRVFGRVFNGATWDRMAGNTTGVAIANASSALADSLSNTELSQTAVAGGVMYPRTFGHYFNGTSWDRARGNTTGASPSNASSAAADGLSNTQLTPTDNAAAVLYPRTFAHVFNGTGWDRQRGNPQGTLVQGPDAATVLPTGNPLAVYRGNTGGAYEPFVCTAPLPFTAGAAATTRIFGNNAGTAIRYICEFAVSAAGASTWKVVGGTGGACGTNQTDLTGVFNAAANQYFNAGTNLEPIVKSKAGDDLCIVTTGAGAVTGVVTVAVF